MTEPVERLADGDRVDAVLGQRNVLCRAAQGFGAGNRAHELRAHRVPGLDGDDPCTGLEQLTGQLSRSGAEIEHGSTFAELQLFG